MVGLIKIAGPFGILKNNFLLPQKGGSRLTQPNGVASEGLDWCTKIAPHCMLQFEDTPAHPLHAAAKGEGFRVGGQKFVELPRV